MNIWIAKNENGKTFLFTEKPSWVKDRKGNMSFESKMPKVEIRNDKEEAFNLQPGQIIEYMPLRNKVLTRNTN